MKEIRVRYVNSWAGIKLIHITDSPNPMAKGSVYIRDKTKAING
jgi:hypothetical protein